MVDRWEGARTWRTGDNDEVTEQSGEPRLSAASPGGNNSETSQVQRPLEPGELRATGRRNARLSQTVSDMARSMIVVLVVVGAILLVTWRPQPDAVRAVDPTSALITARATAGFPILYPQGLTSDWVPTSVRWDLPADAAPDPAWHVGFVTPQEQYAALGQSATTNPEYLPAQTQGGAPAGPGPEGWQRYENTAPEPTRSLVTTVDGVTIVVSGTTSWEVLLDFAERLSPTAVPTVS